MLTENDHASGLCCMITAMTADCAPPIKFIHVVIDSGAGYLFIVNAYRIHICTLHHLFLEGKFLIRYFFFLLNLCCTLYFYALVSEF